MRRVQPQYGAVSAQKDNCELHKNIRAHFGGDPAWALSLSGSYFTCGQKTNTTSANWICLWFVPRLPAKEPGLTETTHNSVSVLFCSCSRRVHWSIQCSHFKYEDTEMCAQEKERKGEGREGERPCARACRCTQKAQGCAECVDRISSLPQMQQPEAGVSLLAGMTPNWLYSVHNGVLSSVVSPFIDAVWTVQRLHSCMSSLMSVSRSWCAHVWVWVAGARGEPLSV